NASRNPAPASPADPHPAAVVKRRPAPAEVADPDPRVGGGETPVSVRHVGREFDADDRARGDPNGAVRWVVLPRAVRVERLAEVVERGGIGIGGDVVFGRIGGLGRRVRRRGLTRGGRWCVTRGRQGRGGRVLGGGLARGRSGGSLGGRGFGTG